MSFRAGECRGWGQAWKEGKKIHPEEAARDKEDHCDEGEETASPWWAAGKQGPRGESVVSKSSKMVKGTTGEVEDIRTVIDDGL